MFSKEELEALAGVVAQSVAQAMSAVNVPAAQGPPAATRRVVLRKASTGEETEKAVKVPAALARWKTLTDPELDRYLMVVYAARDKEAGVYFYGCALLWGMMVRRAYRHIPLSPPQFVFIRKMLASRDDNLRVLDGPFKVLDADFRKRKLDPQDVIDAADKTRRERKALSA